MPAKTCIRPAKLKPYEVVMPLELIGAMWWPTVPYRSQGCLAQQIMLLKFKDELLRSIFSLQITQCNIRHPYLIAGHLCSAYLFIYVQYFIYACCIWCIISTNLQGDHGTLPYLYIHVSTQLCWACWCLDCGLAISAPLWGRGVVRHSGYQDPRIPYFCQPCLYLLAGFRPTILPNTRP